MLEEHVRPHIFDLLDYFSRRSEKLEFQKIKIKIRCQDPVVKNVTMIVAEVSMLTFFSIVVHHLLVRPGNSD